MVLLLSVFPSDDLWAGVRPRPHKDRLGRPRRWEMGEIMSESDAAVLRFLPDRSRRPWEVGVMEGTDYNTDMVWP